MPILALLMLFIQVALVIHAIRTARETFWVYIILFVPAIGSMIYFVTQILPHIGESKSVVKMNQVLAKAIDPQKELRHRKDQLEIANTTDNRMQLADECLEAGFTTDAMTLYQSCLKGDNEFNPHIMLCLAKAYFQSIDYQQCKEQLDQLIQTNPHFKSAEGHLLYARSLEKLGRHTQALEEYAALVQCYPGEEARVRYAMLLKKSGAADQANEVFGETLLRSKSSPNYYKKKRKEVD